MATTTKEVFQKQTSKIMLVDDHSVVRFGLSQLIDGAEDLTVCAVAGSINETILAIDRAKPDLLLVDLSLKDGSGLDLIEQIRARDKEIKILVASMHDETLYADRALQAGANGYINKEEATEQIIDAIRHVLNGKVYLSPSMSERMLQRVVHPELQPPETPEQSLSNRELEVFEMIGRGDTTREIAKMLHLSVKTIESHRENIKRKLGLSNSQELLRRAVEWVLHTRP